MKLIRICAVVLAGAVALAVAGCDAKDDAGADSGDKDTSASTKKESDDTDDSTAESKDEATADPGAVTAITLTKSGGISGIEESLEVGPKGDWTYVKARMAPKEGELSGEERDELLTLAVDGRITDADKKSDKQCNDMQTYRLVVELAEGDEVEAHTDECGISPNEQFDDLVQLLSEATPI